MAIRPDTDEMIAFLDSLAKIDPVAMGKLLAARVPCNEQMAKHPSVQVGHPSEFGGDAKDQTFVVGFLGVLNGYAGMFDDGPMRGWGPISAVVEKDGSVTGFKRTAVRRPHHD